MIKLEFQNLNKTIELFNNLVETFQPKGIEGIFDIIMVLKKMKKPDVKELHYPKLKLSAGGRLSFSRNRYYENVLKSGVYDGEDIEINIKGYEKTQINVKDDFIKVIIFCNKASGWSKKSEKVKQIIINVNKVSKGDLTLKLDEVNLI